eukprot:2370366-Amphidinium_carterae.1
MSCSSCTCDVRLGVAALWPTPKQHHRTQSCRCYIRNIATKSVLLESKRFEVKFGYVEGHFA